MDNYTNPQATEPPKASDLMPADPKLETRRILLYLAITFFITYLVEIAVIRPVATGGNDQMKPFLQLLVSSVMFFPALGVLLTRLITKEGFRNSLLRMPNFKKNLPYYLFAWFGPAVLTVIGAILYFLIFPGKFDATLPTLAKAYQDSGLEVSTIQLQSTMITQIITAILIGPLINFITCFGEEWGWRGYLLPKMKRKFKILPVLLINGLIWGIWHAPLTALGHNYGTGYAGFPYTGILAMSIFCIVIGTIFSYITIKTNSCIPAVFAHGSINSFSAVGIYFTTDGGNPFLGPSPTGVIGGIGFIAVAIIFTILLVKNEKRTA